MLGILFYSIWQTMDFHSTSGLASTRNWMNCISKITMKYFKCTWITNLEQWCSLARCSVVAVINPAGANSTLPPNSSQTSAINTIPAYAIYCLTNNNNIGVNRAFKMCTECISTWTPCSEGYIIKQVAIATGTYPLKWKKWQGLERGRAE